MDVLLIIAAVAVAVWAWLYLERGSLVAGCLALLIAGRCFSKYFYPIELGGISLSVDLLLTGLILGGSICQRLLHRADSKPWGRAEWANLALLALLAFSTFTHNWRVDRPDQFPDADRNTLGAAPHFRLIVGFVLPFLLYLVVRQSRLDRRAVRWVFAAFAAFGVYLAVTGVAEITHQWWLVFPSFIADPHVGIHFGRARGPMLQSVSYGMALGSCLFVVCVWRTLFTDPRRRFLLLLLVPVLLAGIYASFTRSVWIGTGLGLAAIVMLTWRSKFKPLVLAGGIAVAALVSLLNLDRLEGFERDGSAAATRSSADMRACFAYVSWQIFLDRPLDGLGFGHFREGKLPYLDDHSTDLLLQGIRNWTHHNGYLNMLVENGVAGFLLFLIVVGSWWRNAWLLARRWDAPAWSRAFGVLTLATYCCQLMFHELAYSALDQAWIFIVCGMCSGLLAMAEREAVGQPRPASDRVERARTQPRLSPSLAVEPIAA